MSIKEKLAGLRGREYFDVWADWWKSEAADPVRDDVKDHIARKQFTCGDLVRICDRHDLPWKTFVEQLEKDGKIRTGTYAKMPQIGKLRAHIAQVDAERHDAP